MIHDSVSYFLIIGGGCKMLNSCFWLVLFVMLVPNARTQLTTSWPYSLSSSSSSIAGKCGYYNALQVADRAR